MNPDTHTLASGGHEPSAYAASLVPKETGALAPPARPEAGLKVLLTEGSSLSARQTLYALGDRGHTIDLCDPRPILCLGNFSRFVRKAYRCPSFTRDPAGYLRFLRDRLRAEHYDVLVPTHDQAYLLSRFQEVFRPLVGLALPPFEVMERMQSKVKVLGLFEELGLPHPATAVVRSRAELERVTELPVWVKLAHSTAGCGVWKVQDRNQLTRLAEELERAGRLEGRQEVLVQQPAAGVLCVAQSVFQRGRLVGAHCYQSRAVGVGGSARARVGVHHPRVVGHLAQVGRHLNWHGALMLEYLFDPDSQALHYIEANPRIGETLNATLSGLNLCELLLQVSREEEVEPQPSPRPGVRTHSLVMGLMALAQQGQGRLPLVAELWRGLWHRGLYQDSQDEITWIRRDLLSMCPAGFVIGRLLLSPAAVHAIVQKTVDNYGLSEAAVQALRQLPPELEEWAAQ
jgi:predicted ATP-grasp superfamily ATP-dependent carboligase